MSLERRTRLKVDLEKTRAWIERSRRRGGLAPRSEKARGIAEERETVTRPAVIARDGERCFGAEVLPEVRCARAHGRRDLELHEVVARSQWKGGVTDPANCRLLCPAHHDYVTHDAVGIARGREVGLVRSAPRLR